MQQQRRTLSAVVDESSNRDQTFYVMAAAVLDDSRSRVRDLMRALEAQAPVDERGRPYIHANEMDESSRSKCERVMGEHNAVRFIATVKAPIGAGGMEEARQRCLAELAVQLSKRYRVNRMTLDTRDDIHLDPAAAREYGSLHNPRDRATLAALKGEGELPPDFSFTHRDDQHSHQLWLADLAAHAVHRSIRDNDPNQVAPIAHKCEIREAARLPVEERSVPGRVEERNGVGMALNRLHALALRIKAIEVGGQDDPATRELADELAERADLEREMVERVENRLHPPPLEHYTGQHQDEAELER